jgi:aquaporin Z
VLYAIAPGRPGFDPAAGLGANGYGAHSPGGYSLTAALVCELVMTFFLLLVILGSTDRRTPAGLAPIATWACSARASRARSRPSECGRRGPGRAARD